MKKQWKYFIALNKDRWDYVEGEETPDGLPIGNDFSMAKWFDSPDELNKWVRDHTTLSIEKEEYHIEGHYVIVNDDETHGCYCCLGDENLYWKDEENNAFVDSKGDILVTIKGMTMRYRVKYCPNCGRKF